MFQHPAQLRLSVRQNVTMEATTSPDADQRVWAVLADVGLEEVIRALPRGLDSILGGGFGAEVNLSGGQWQRLVLARTLYRDASLVILDEPSSHLDAEAEGRLLDMLTHGLRERMVVVVTHRRETLQACDRYLELADGAVSASGAVTGAFPAVVHPYLGGAADRPPDANPDAKPDARDVSSLKFFGNLDLVCSFCARQTPVPPGAMSEPDAVICAECAELAVEVLSRPTGPEQPQLDCSFCGSDGLGTVPGPDGVAICAPCAQRWLEGVRS
jgi:ABC-type glutathione transport system ATPase component